MNRRSPSTPPSRRQLQSQQIPSPQLPAAHPGPAAVLVTRDRSLAEQLAVTAQAVGVPLAVVPAPSAVPRAARLVLVGLDAVADVRPGRRGLVIVVRVEGGDPPDGVWRRAVHLGAERVVLLPQDEPWLVERLLDAAGPARRAPVVGVVAACGGAGASALALGLAVTAAAHGLRPVLVDADPLGGGLDLPLGADAVEGLRWPELPAPGGRLPAGVIRTALPEVEGVRVLTCRRGEAGELSTAAVGAVLDAATRECDLVVVDLPRHPGDVEVAVLPRCRLVLLVVPARVRGISAAGQVAAAIEAHAADVRVVVREPLAPGLVPEAVAEALQLPLAGRLRPEPGLAAALDRGEILALPPRGPLAALSREVLDTILEPA